MNRQPKWETWEEDLISKREQFLEMNGLVQGSLQLPIGGDRLTG